MAVWVTKRLQQYVLIPSAPNNTAANQWVFFEIFCYCALKSANREVWVTTELFLKLDSMSLGNMDK